MYYYVLVKWLEWDSKTNDYTRHHKKFPALWAKDTTEASQKALAMSPDGICKSISMLWRLWPQPSTQNVSMGYQSSSIATTALSTTSTLNSSRPSVSLLKPATP